MALQIQSPSSTTTKPYHLLFSKPNKSNLKTLQSTPNPPKNQQHPRDPNPLHPAKALAASSSSSSSTSWKANVTAVTKKKAQPKSKRERVRASVVGRTAVEKLSVINFLLGWVLSGSFFSRHCSCGFRGFLPEEWDKLLGKYLYPTFTPTVGLFVAGTVA